MAQWLEHEDWSQVPRPSLNDPYTKLASKTSHLQELWVWLKDPDTKNTVEEQPRMIPGINRGPPHATTQQYTCKTYIINFHIHTTLRWKWRKKQEP